MKVNINVKTKANGLETLDILNPITITLKYFHVQ